MKDKISQPELRIFYDGACHLCSAEIEHYRKKDKENKLGYVDISDPSFDAKALGKDPKIINKYFHVQTKNGEWIQGVDAFAEIWKHLPSFHWAARIASFAPAKAVMNVGYEVFSHVRPYLPKKKCADGSCELN